MKIFAKGEWRNDQGQVIGGYQIRGAEDGEDSDEAEIFIYGDIGQSWFGESVTAAQFVKDLQALGDIEYLTVRINSFGGSVADGMAIYNAIRRHDSAKTVEIDGVAMSAASLVAMSGDTVRMAENGILMIHAPWGFAMGNAVVMREYADILDKYAAAMSASYARKTGRPKEEMRELLTDGKDHFYDAEEALDDKFIDAISDAAAVEEDDDDEDEEYSAAAVLRAAQARYQVPATLAAAAFKPKEAISMKGTQAPPAATAQPANPNPPAAAPSNVTEIEAAAAVKERERIAVRNKELRALFKPFLAREDVDVQPLLDEAIDDTSVTVDAVRAKLLAKLGESAAPISGAASVRPGADSRDKFLRGAADWLMIKAGVTTIVEKSGHKPDAGEYRGLSLLDLAKECLTRAGINYRGWDKADIVAAAFAPHAAGFQTTSDFPVLLENTMHKVLLAAFGITPDSWSRFCATGSVSDFRPHNRYRMGTFGALDALTEHGEFKDKVIPDALKELITLKTKGNIIGLSRQAIINDDMDAFSRLATMFGRAAKLSVEVDVYASLASNGGLGPLLNDGKTLFHADHANINAVGSALSVDGIDADRVVLASQKDHSGNEFLDLRPAILALAIGLGGNARVVNDAQYDPDTANKLQKPNKVRGLFRDIVDTPRLTGTRRYLFAEPTVAPVLEVAFLEGQREPVLETKDGWRIDGVEWKVSYDYAVGGVGFHGAVTNAGV